MGALEAVLEARGGKLGANVKLVLEMAEERGSRGLREFVAANAGLLSADALIASDGPRITPELPTIATGTRAAAPAEVFQAEAVTPTERRCGTMTPCPPKAATERMIAPRLRGSVMPSIATTSGKPGASWSIRSEGCAYS